MKTKYTFLTLLFTLFSFSQKIECNNSKAITVIFPSNIISANTGNANFKVLYETAKETLSPILFIKAKLITTNESNLIVKTEDNMFYNITLIYSKNIASEKNNIIIDVNTGIPLTKKSVSTPPTKETIVVPTVENKITEKTIVSTEKKELNIRENDYTIGMTIINDADNKVFECAFCENILKQGKEIKRIFANNFDIKINLESLYYTKNELYITVNIENNSSVDYNINFIKTYVQLKKPEKIASTQYLEKNPQKIYNAKRTISAKKNLKMIFIYDQFTIDSNKNLTFELNEANGERNLSLIIPNNIINNPTKF